MFELLADTDQSSFGLSTLLTLWLYVKVALGIGLVIFVHELGHFVAAKSFGVKCEKFYIGFDVPIQIGPIKFPRTLGKFTSGETEYGIGILPLGGYVKMLGQDDDPRRAQEEAERIRISGGDPDAAPQFDPRSYPAKPVWQRMIIISAGVVMNVITGVLFAAFAFFSGVEYTPAVVGTTTAGGPAWQAGIQPGGRVIAVSDYEDDDQLHFSDMTSEILQSGLSDPDKPVNVRLSYGDETREYRLTTQPNALQPDLRMIGIQSAPSNKLLPKMVAVIGSAAASVLTEQDAGAEVIAVNGTSIQTDSPMPIQPLLQEQYTRPGKEIELTLVGTDGQTKNVTVPVQKTKDFGVRFGIGPITGLIENGPADKAGLKVGDRVVAINDDRNLDAYSLILNPIQPNSPVQVTVLRGLGDAAEEKTFTVDPADRSQVNAPVSMIADAMASDPLGIAYRPTAVVVGLNDGESALQMGDEIRELRFIFSDPEVRRELTDRLPEDAVQAISEGWEIGPSMPLTTLMEVIQTLPVGATVEIKAVRPPDGQVIEANLAVVTSDRPWYDRGLNFSAISDVHVADSFSAALGLGVREAGRRMTDVLRFLKMLVQGRVKAKYVGGPVRIVQMASKEAERGISAQLLFLTMLSMNLAILNFLPIPALDGGHMLFLTAEAVRGRRVDEALEMRLTFAGVLALLCLMVFVFANDILHLL